MHQPNRSSVAGSCFSVRGLAPPDSLAAWVTPLSINSKGSRLAASRRMEGQWSSVPIGVLGALLSIRKVMSPSMLDKKKESVDKLGERG